MWIVVAQSFLCLLWYLWDRNVSKNNVYNNILSNKITFCFQPDLQLIPYTVNGTYSTPPIKKYDSPDGEYVDISKKWGEK